MAAKMWIAFAFALLLCISSSAAARNELSEDIDLQSSEIVPENLMHTSVHKKKYKYYCVKLYGKRCYRLCKKHGYKWYCLKYRYYKDRKCRWPTKKCY